MKLAHRGGGRRRRLLPLAVLLACVACSPPRAPDLPDLPEGTVVLGSTAAVRPLLEALLTLPVSPLVDAARSVAAGVAQCAEFEIVCPPGGSCDLEGGPRCAGADPQLEPIRALRKGAGWIVTHRSDTSAWLARGRQDSEDSAIEIEIELTPGPEMPAFASLLLPAGNGPGVAVLSPRDAFLHLRLRPSGGLDLANLLPADGWGARLFRLQSRLFEATTLAGTWELAVYLPGEGQLIPPMALALDVTERERAAAAMETFLSEIRATWTLRRRGFELAAGQGACLTDLNVMPELEPCYLATPQAVVIGWNASSLELALADSGRQQSGDTGERSWARLDLGLLGVADRRLAAASGSGDAEPAAYPWRMALAESRREGGLYRISVELSP